MMNIIQRESHTHSLTEGYGLACVKDLMNEPKEEEVKMEQDLGRKIKYFGLLFIKY